jgi:hypothetical protein
MDVIYALALVALGAGLMWLGERCLQAKDPLDVGDLGTDTVIVPPGYHPWHGYGVLMKDGLWIEVEMFDGSSAVGHAGLLLEGGDSIKAVRIA